MDEPHTTRADESRKAEIKERGLAALRFIYSNQTWERWMDIGEAMLVITEEACTALGAAAWDKDNKPLVKLFNKKWDEYEQRAHNDPAHRPLSKQERSALRFVMANPEVGAFRAGLQGPEKRRLNHPNAVINSWRADKNRRERTKTMPKRVDPTTLAPVQAKDETAAARIAELELAKAGADLDARALKAKYADLEVELRELRTMDMSHYGADAAGVITALRSEVAALKAASKATKAIRSHREAVFTPAEDNKITICLHPDTRASRSDKERDEAFRIYNEKRDVLVKKGEKPASSMMPFTPAAKAKVKAKRALTHNTGRKD